jgi:hypothetical protein
MNDQKSQQTAQTRAKEKVEFRIHLISYFAVMTLLALINLTLTPGYIWFKWPLLGWGIGIILHALNVYYTRIENIKEWMIEQEMKKENQYK